MIDEETAEDERTWKKRRFDGTKERLEEGALPPDRRHVATANLAKSARDVAICEYVVGSHDAGREWMDTAADYFVQRIDVTVELEDEIEGAERAHRPKYCADAVHTALLAGRDPEPAVQRALAIDESWYLDTYPEFAHVFHYVRALAYLLSDAPDDARHEVERYEDLGETYVRYDAAVGCVAGVLESDPDAVVEHLDALLSHHADELHGEPSTAVDFVSVQASALFSCATARHVDVSRDDLDPEHADFLLVV